MDSLTKDDEKESLDEANSENYITAEEIE